VLSWRLRYRRRAITPSDRFAWDAAMDRRMSRRRKVYEGKAKVLFEGPEPGTLIQYFKDDATAFNNQKQGVITGKGVLNNRISEHLMLRLAAIGVPTHFVRRLNMREQLIKEVEIIPLEVVVRNVVAGSLDKRIVLADEISPDSCRLWDVVTNEKLDKDRFRRDLGRVEEGYQEVARRLGILPEAGLRDLKGPETVQ
jgi:phosphoribosylaminoimidazole-succinocarboxamide synthase